MSLHPFFKKYPSNFYKLKEKYFTVILSKNASAAAKKKTRRGRQISVIVCEVKPKVKLRYDTSKSILYKDLMTKFQS